MPPVTLILKGLVQNAQYIVNGSTVRAHQDLCAYLDPIFEKRLLADKMGRGTLEINATDSPVFLIQVRKDN